MKRSITILLIAAAALLTGCEADQSAKNAPTERSGYRQKVGESPYHAPARQY